MNLSATAWPRYGHADPLDVLDAHLRLARDTNGVLWVRASRAYTRPEEFDHVRSEARSVYETLRMSPLAYDDYIEVWPPKEFFGDYAIAVRLTTRGRCAVTAHDDGFCWSTTRHEPDIDETLAYWREKLRYTKNPHSELFQRVQKLHPVELHVLRGESTKRLQELWRERVDAMDDVRAHDWPSIVNNRDPELAVVSEYARARHNQMWIAELQNAHEVDDWRLRTVERLPDDKYRDAKNEAMLVKMRVWKPLDHNGRRVR